MEQPLSIIHTGSKIMELKALLDNNIAVDSYWDNSVKVPLPCKMRDVTRLRITALFIQEHQGGIMFHASIDMLRKGR